MNIARRDPGLATYFTPNRAHPESEPSVCSRLVKGNGPTAEFARFLSTYCLQNKPMSYSSGSPIYVFTLKISEVFTIAGDL
jgi:hypothetical protein